jgi:hypothetical protein
LICPSKTKTTHEANKENIIVEEMDDGIQIKDSESELDLVTIRIERNGQSSIIPLKNTESKNEREDPGSELITYALPVWGIFTLKALPHAF